MVLEEKSHKGRRAGQDSRHLSGELESLMAQDIRKLRAQIRDWDGSSGHLVHPCAMLESLLIILAMWLSSLHIHTSTDEALTACRRPFYPWTALKSPESKSVVPLRVRNLYSGTAETIPVAPSMLQPCRDWRMGNLMPASEDFSPS